MTHTQREAVRLTMDAMGRLMEFWGFKRHHGRAWAGLFLAEKPLDTAEIAELLELSQAAVGQVLADLKSWGIVRSVWLTGDRAEHFEAETNLWKMISRVLEERERKEIVAAREAFEKAAALLKQARVDADPAARALAKMRHARVEGLLELARVGQNLLDALLATARVDVSPLKAFSALLRPAKK
jgi:DNA-binding transcriptional regulator GbsR (MarR family)